MVDITADASASRNRLAAPLPHGWSEFLVPSRLLARAHRATAACASSFATISREPRGCLLPLLFALHDAPASFECGRCCAVSLKAWHEDRFEWPPEWSRAMNKPASLAELDKLQSIHPFTNLRKHEQKGPVVMTRGRGIYVYDDQGREYIEGMAGLWCASLGFSDERLIAAATRQLNTLPYYHGFAHKTSDVAVRAAADLLALAPATHGAGHLRHQRLGCQRHRDQAGALLQQRARPTGEEEDHRPHQGLPRRQRRGRHTDRAAAPAHRLRSAGAGCRARRLSAPLSLRPGRRRRRGVCGAVGATTSGADRKGRRRQHRGVHRRTGDGRGRRDPRRRPVTSTSSSRS